jgi:hypothetical protein
VIRALRALGLDGTADERAIKRAYAARLRECRPDEDAAAFQRLNEAYQEALEWARRRAASAPSRPRDRGTADAEPPALTMRMDAPQWQPLNFDLQPGAPKPPDASPAPPAPAPPAPRIVIDDATSAPADTEAPPPKPRVRVSDAEGTAGETAAEGVPPPAPPNPSPNPSPNAASKSRLKIEAADAPPDETRNPPTPPKPRLNVTSADAPAEQDYNPPVPPKSRLNVSEAERTNDDARDPSTPPKPRLIVTEGEAPPERTEEAPAPWRRLRVEDAPREPAARVVPPPPPAAPPAPFDPVPLLADFVDEAVNAMPGPFAAWMNARPELWSLRDKAIFGRTLIQHLGAEIPPIRSDNTKEIIAFFAIDDVHSGYDVRGINDLRMTMHEVWIAEQDLRGSARIPLGRDRRGRPTYGREYGQKRIQASQGQRHVTALRRFAREECPELLGRWWWPSMFWRALSRSRYERIVAAVEGLDLDALPSGFDRRAIAFWRSAAEPQVLSWARVFVALSVTLGFCLTLLIPLVALMIPAMARGEPRLPVLVTPVIITFSCFAFWLAVQLSRWLVRWQTGPDPASGPLRWLHPGFVPATLAFTLASGWTGDPVPMRVTILPYLLILMLCRLNIRHGASLPSVLYRLTEQCEEWLSSTGYGPVMVLTLVLTTAIEAAVIASSGGTGTIAPAIAIPVAILWVWDLVLSILDRRRRA